MAQPILGQHLYYIETRDTNTDLVSAHNDGISMHYVRRTNGIGMMIWTVEDGHPILPILTDDLFFRVFLGLRTKSGFEQITWYEDFLGVYREKQTSTDENGNIYHLLYIPHANEILTRSIIAYTSGTTDKSQWVSTDIGDVIADVISGNITTTSPLFRLRNVDKIGGIDANVPPVIGTTIDYSCAWRPVNEVLRDLRQLGDVYIEVEWDGSVGVTVRPEYHTAQIGADVSDAILFDLGLNNVRIASKRENRAQEKTVAIVAGKGAGSSRDTSVRTGDNYSATHSYEVLVDARDKDIGELPSIGDARLAELKANTIIDSEILQTQGYMYKRDYNFGDRVEVRFNNIFADRLIDEVSVTFAQDGSVTILIGLIDV